MMHIDTIEANRSHPLLDCPRDYDAARIRPPLLIPTQSVGSAARKRCAFVRAGPFPVRRSAARTRCRLLARIATLDSVGLPTGATVFGIHGQLPGFRPQAEAANTVGGTPRAARGTRDSSRKQVRPGPNRTSLASFTQTESSEWLGPLSVKANRI
jgi:hypothetical protein